MTSQPNPGAPKRPLAVVTGASGGIGREICTQLREAGFAIIGQFNSNPARANALSDEISSHGGLIELVQADLSTAEGPGCVTESVGEFLSDHDDYQLKLVVNNAGKLLGPSLDSATPTSFDQYMAINVRAPLFLIQGLRTFLSAGASVVNISSASAHLSSPGDLVYAISKAALESLTHNLAEELAHQGVRINTVIPGFTDNGHPGFAVPEVAEYMGSFSLLGGVATPSDIAAAVVFLASEAANRITGASLDLTGGALINARGSRGPGVRSILESSGSKIKI